MDLYNLGKDIQQILDRLERLERAPDRNTSKCTCDQDARATDIQSPLAGELVWEGDAPCFFGDGGVQAFASKSWRYPTGRICNGYCNWREPEFVTIWSNGNYLLSTEVRCEHGYLFGCTFKSEYSFLDDRGGLLESLNWSRSLGGTQSASIVVRGWSQRIRDSYIAVQSVGLTRSGTC